MVSCPVFSCLLLSYLALFCLVLHCLLLSYLGLPCLASVRLAANEHDLGCKRCDREGRHNFRYKGSDHSGDVIVVVVRMATVVVMVKVAMMMVVVRVSGYQNAHHS